MTTPIQFESQEAFEKAALAYVKQNLVVKGNYGPMHEDSNGQGERCFELSIVLKDETVFSDSYM